MWDLLIINPITNALLWLYDILGNNFILALTVFTIFTRILMLPLNLRQQRSMAKTQEMQPQIRAIQQKYKDNPQKMQEEFQKIGYNPAESLSGCLPLLATMPILFGLFQVLRLVLGSTPQALFELTQRVYPGIDLTNLLPIKSNFLWLNLGQPDPLYILPILVFVTMFLQTKLTTPAAAKKDDSKSNNKKGNGKEQNDDPTAAMTQSMQYTMPIMFGFFSLSFQSGLSIYFVLSNLIGIAQGFYTRRVMEAEREALAQEKELKAMGLKGGTSFSEPEMSIDRPSKETKDQATQGDNKKQSQSKRKRRSAKR
ncbi:MAG: membrane protein insertase YidC [Ardenticatenaceae bacterium]|nr:membrane protein insertase YidC [Ardenticatenaceae bacterium]MCB8948365.1 membrane protein insertase YidC [Ardenticatenaceae bacterium]